MRDVNPGTTNGADPKHDAVTTTHDGVTRTGLGFEGRALVNPFADLTTVSVNQGVAQFCRRGSRAFSENSCSLQGSLLCVRSLVVGLVVSTSVPGVSGVDWQRSGFVWCDALRPRLGRNSEGPIKLHRPSQPGRPRAAEPARNGTRIRSNLTRCLIHTQPTSGQDIRQQFRTYRWASHG